EHPLLARADDHGADPGMLEADAVQGVVKLDVDPEVVGVELQLVAGPDAALLVDIEGEPGDPPLDGELPVSIALGMRLESDQASSSRAPGTRENYNAAKWSVKNYGSCGPPPFATARRSLPPSPNCQARRAGR